MEKTVDERIADLERQMRWMGAVIQQIAKKAGLKILKQLDLEPVPPAAKKPPTAPVGFPEASMTFISDGYRATRLDGPPGAPEVTIPEPSREPTIRRRIRSMWV